MAFKFSDHARDMLKEPNISEDWVWQAIDAADWKIEGRDGNIHYFKSIIERGGRILHIVVNPHLSPMKIATVFFDRRARRQE
jgi:hypothetical protein